MQTLFLSLCLILSGCGMDLDAEQVSDPQIAAFSNAGLADVSWSIVPLEAPQAYAVELSWPKTDQAIYLKKETDAEYQVIPASTNRTRIEAKGGDLFTLLLETREKDEVTSQRSIEIEVPLDIVIDSTLTLSEDRTLNCERLFLKKSALIRLQNFKFEVNCKELISENALIETFPEGAQAGIPAIDDSPEANNLGGTGRSGAHSVFKFEKVKGVLYVHLRGEAGSNGRNGVRSLDTAFKGWVLGCRGQNAGSGGDTGSLTMITPNSHRLEVIKNLTPGAPGTPGHPNAPWEDAEAIGGISTSKPGFGTCVRNNSNGAPGNSGNKGQICLKESETSNCL